MRVVFILPGRGGGGGAHSVVQETLGLQRLGVTVGIATSASTMTAFRVNYPELEHNRIAVHAFEEPEKLAPVLARYDIACATTWESTFLLSQAISAMGKKNVPKTAYYVQDYEPLFSMPGTTEWEGARRSYTELTDALLFAKTRFLCDVVTANHNRQVAKVSPSIDHGIYFPGSRDDNRKIVISAMLRPKTPRRAPRRTARVLEMLAAAYGRDVELISFGCEKHELAAEGIRLSETVDHRGSLSRKDVAGVLRASDLFLDLSDFQAFGRTGLEGMACGCVPVLPVFGGATEFLKHWTNGFLVDTRSDDEIMRATSAFIDLAPHIREGMRYAAIETALNYTIDKAAFSEFTLFREMLN
jgi:hypothetical protein